MLNPSKMSPCYHWREDQFSPLLRQIFLSKMTNIQTTFDFVCWHPAPWAFEPKLTLIQQEFNSVKPWLCRLFYLVDPYFPVPKKVINRSSVLPDCNNTDQVNVCEGQRTSLCDGAAVMEGVWNPMSRRISWGPRIRTVPFLPLLRTRPVEAGCGHRARQCLAAR